MIVEAESECDDGRLRQLGVDVADRAQVPRVPQSDDAGGSVPGCDDVDGDAEHSISFLRLSHDGSVPPLLIDGARVGR